MFITFIKKQGIHILFNVTNASIVYKYNIILLAVSSLYNNNQGPETCQAPIPLWTCQGGVSGDMVGCSGSWCVVLVAIHCQEEY